MFLGKVLGYRLHLFLSDTLVFDRYRWLKKWLPETNEDLELIDVGCGSGAFTMAAASCGYNSIGLSWDKRDKEEATKFAKLAGFNSRVSFVISDARKLGQKKSYKERFDVCLNFENIEHIIDDQKLMKDIYDILKPGGLLLFSTPNYFYRPISKSDKGPFNEVEDGGHVRRGYSTTMLRELCQISGFEIEKISGCSGFFSQKITKIYRFCYPFSPLFAWLVILPLRILPPLFDKLIQRFLGGVNYSICMVAVKPRFHGKS